MTAISSAVKTAIAQKIIVEMYGRALKSNNEKIEAIVNKLAAAKYGKFHDQIVNALGTLARDFVKSTDRISWTFDGDSYKQRNTEISFSDKGKIVFHRTKEFRLNKSYFVTIKDGIYSTPRIVPEGKSLDKLRELLAENESITDKATNDYEKICALMAQVKSAKALIQLLPNADKFIPEAKVASLLVPVEQIKQYNNALKGE